VVFEKARFDQTLQQSSTYLPVEACHLRGVRRRQRCAGDHEQTPDTRERLFHTSRLE
jgi:hypothetical protein